MVERTFIKDILEFVLGASLDPPHARDWTTVFVSSTKPRGACGNEDTVDEDGAVAAAGVQEREYDNFSLSGVSLSRLASYVVRGVIGLQYLCVRRFISLFARFPRDWH